MPICYFLLSSVGHKRKRLSSFPITCYHYCNINQPQVKHEKTENPLPNKRKEKDSPFLFYSPCSVSWDVAGTPAWYSKKTIFPLTVTEPS